MTIYTKLFTPSLEHAALEEDDELQDLWANLLASAVDPKFEGMIRSAYIDIIRQLEVVDVHLLRLVYDSFVEWLTEKKRIAIQDDYYLSPIDHAVGKLELCEQLGISFSVFENAVDNLMRVRCLASYVEERVISMDLYDYPRSETVSIDSQYEFVCITSLGVSFVEACTRTS